MTRVFIEINTSLITWWLFNVTSPEAFSINQAQSHNYCRGFMDV